MIGVQTCYLASFRDQVAGSVTFIGNTTSDTDGMELGSNLVGRNMTCLNNLPAVQFGDASAAPNMVGGIGTGECGFNVVLSNPSAGAVASGSPGPSVPVHISVSTQSLGTYYGTHTQTASTSITSLLGPNVTESGNTLLGALNNDTLTGTGLVGSMTVDPSAPLGSTGELVVATDTPGYPSAFGSSESFEATDNCTCSFAGQVGAVSLKLYGTTSHGWTTGTFLVVQSGGGIGLGALDTLAGYGTFSGQLNGTLNLVEHLKIT